MKGNGDESSDKLPPSYHQIYHNAEEANSYSSRAEDAAIQISQSKPATFPDENLFAPPPSSTTLEPAFDLESRLQENATMTPLLTSTSFTRNPILNSGPTNRNEENKPAELILPHVMPH